MIYFHCITFRDLLSFYYVSYIKTMPDITSSKQNIVGLIDHCKGKYKNSKRTHFMGFKGDI